MKDTVMVLHKAEPRDELIKRLEVMLEEAKAGELIAAAFATEKRGGNISTGWTTPANNFTLMSACSILHQRMAASLADA